LFDLPIDECRRVLSGLEREGFLRRTSDGRYRLPA
jgi:DNA-binding IclR family transcriptional regulator